MDGRFDTGELKRLAAGRWKEILTAAGAPEERLNGQHHPCPRCGGTDRFRLIDADAGAVLCNQCFSSGNGDGLAAVQWMLGLDFPAACEWLGDYLGCGVSNGRPERDPIAEFATAKGVRPESLLLYGARSALRGDGRVCQLPMFDADGAEVGAQDYGLAGKLSKGLTVRGSKAGLFRPQRDGSPIVPQQGETWFLSEGVKDAAAMSELSLMTVGLGAATGKRLTGWAAELLRGCHVRIAHDLDQSGLKTAERLSGWLEGVAASVKIVRLPGELTGSGGDDVRDVRRRMHAEHGPQAGDDRLRQLLLRDDAARVSGRRPVMRCMADVAPQPVDWLWPGRIARGKLTMIAGDPGLGKSFLSCDMAAHVSTGAPWPDGQPCPMGDVLLLNAEDDAADTIRPRLDAAGADPARVQVLDGVDPGDGQLRAVSLQDLPVIESALDAMPDCLLLVVDPVSAYCGDADSHRNAEVRAMLSPLASLAASRGVAVAAVTHLRKGEGAAIYRPMGSLAFVAAARAAWAVVRDPDDSEQRLLLPVKNNIAPDSGGLRFALKSGALGCHIEWRGEETRSVDEVMAPPRGRPSAKVQAAASWLQEQLATGPIRTDELQSRAAKAGHAWRTVRRAADELPLDRRQEGRFAWWGLPGGDADAPWPEPESLIFGQGQSGDDTAGSPQSDSPDSGPWPKRPVTGQGGDDEADAPWPEHSGQGADRPDSDGPDGLEVVDL